MRIDAHHHVWDLGRTPQTWMTAEHSRNIGRDFGFDDWLKVARPASVSKSVVVQTVDSWNETPELLALAATRAEIHGVVGWIDFESDLDEQFAYLEHCRGFDRLVGIRDLTEYREDPRWLLGDPAHSSFDVAADRDLAVDLLVKPEHLEAAAAAVARHPSTRFVLDHLGKPDLDRGDVKGWIESLGVMARSSNVAMKLSGFANLTTQDDWSNALRPYFERAVDSFGPERIMFGSDWPVCLLSGSYSDVVEVVEGLVSGLSTGEQDAIWAGTARRWYRPRGAEEPR